ncbi:hypothetical protein [Desulfovibrio sp. TomC]|uniref:hypothetical protein n=1 Tax=Desulfovibrio sp. TomC TaxID=1562888 RepID=UPI000573A1F0|nr:hypothetical protein [Desulfovibrio sp. TomC]KHK01075.1 Cytochrome c family protein [Desulfovibrio sp. TomC]
MKRLCALWPLFLLALPLPPAAWGATITTPFLSDWQLVITMDADGDAGLVSPLGYKLENEQPTVSFQAQGHQRLTVTAVYTGSSQGTPFFDVWNYTVAPTLEYTAQATVKEGQFLAEPWYDATYPDGFVRTWGYTVALELRTPGGETVPGTAVQGVLSLNIRQFRHAWLEYGRLCVSDIQATLEASTKLPVDAETYSLEAASPLEISPAQVVTSAYVYAGYAPFSLTCPLSAFDSGPVSGKVTAEGGSAPPLSRTLSVPFATVLTSDWGVEIKNQISGEWTALSNGTTLAKGDWIRMQPVEVYGTVRLPSMAVQFADGQIREVTLEPGYDQSQAGEVIIEVGQGALLTHNVCWTIKFTNFIQERTENPREYAKEFIWDKLGDAIFDAFAPGTSWPIQKVGSKIIGYGLESVYDATGAHDAPRSARLRPSAAEVAAESQARRADVRGATPSVRPTAAAVLTIKSDGSMTAENRIGTRRVVNAAQQTRLLPPRSQISHKTSFGPVTDLPYASDVPIGTFSVTPTGSTDTRTPLFTFTYSGYGTKYIPETLDARINGTLVQGFNALGGASAAYQVPRAAWLNAGANSVEAAIVEAKSGRQFLAATLYASGAPQAPQRVVGLPGATSMLLSWAASQERGLEGYHIYKGDAAAAVATRLTASPVSGTAYALYTATEPGLAAGAYYGVTAVVAGVESALSTPVQGSLAGPSAAPPEPVTDLAAATAFDRVSLAFTPPAGAIAFRLARPGLDPQIFRSPPFVDTTAVRGTPYTYTVTPLGLDLAAGTPVETTAAIAATTPPPAPTGLTAYAADAAGKTWALRWDPAQTAGIVGVNIYESRDGEAWVKATATPVAGQTLTRTLASPGAYSWLVRSVSSAGVESTNGPILGGGFASRASVPAVATGSAALLLLRE